LDTSGKSDIGSGGAFVAAANIVSVAAEVAKAIVNGYFGMSV